MHPKIASLLAYCDGEADRDGSRRIAGHLAKCEKCRQQVRLIQSEKDELSAGAPTAALDCQQGLPGLLAAMAAWRDDGGSGAASEMKRRLRGQIEMYCGTPAVALVERPGMRAEELLGKTDEFLEVFLGPDEALAISDDVFRGLEIR